MSEAIKIIKKNQLPKSRVILALLEFLLEHNGVWSESQLKLAEQLFCSRNRLGEMLNELEAAGIVEFGKKETFNSPKEIRLRRLYE